MKENLKDKTDWSVTITPHKGWVNFNLRELWNYRDLIILFVHRDFVAKYKQTVLGPLWFIIQPLFTTIVFTIVFGKIANIPTDNIPPMLFYLAGLLTWNYFSTCLTSTSTTFLRNAGIFGKVYFPRLAVPVSVVISNLLAFGIQLFLFLMFYAYFYIKGAPVSPNLWIFTIPLLLIQTAALGLGVGIWISSLTTRYRDLQNAVGFGAQLWMYATPIIYPLSQIPEKWQWVILLNPMTGVVETFKHATLGTGETPLSYMFIGLASTLFILVTGLMLFGRMERDFMDTI